MAEEKHTQERVLWQVRLRRAALFLLFAAVLMIPKTLALRQRRSLWNGLRFLVAVTGALLVGAAQRPQISGWVPLLGLLLIVSALLAQPVRKTRTVDEQGRALGALVALNGGRFQTAKGKLTSVRLFVASERVHVLDPRHRRLLEIPLPAVTELRAEPAGDGWELRVGWQGSRAVFHYEGFFAEHLARVAETTLRSQLQRELPVLS